ncbi:MAG: hypothetical protein AAGF25_10350 [Pseudomonadota bacterium]
MSQQRAPLSTNNAAIDRSARKVVHQCFVVLKSVHNPFLVHVTSDVTTLKP